MEKLHEVSLLHQSDTSINITILKPLRQIDRTFVYRIPDVSKLGHRSNYNKFLQVKQHGITLFGYYNRIIRYNKNQQRSYECNYLY